MNSFTAPLDGAAEGRLELTRGGTHISVRAAEIAELCRAEFEGERPTARAERNHVTIEYPRFSVAELLRHPGHRAEIELTSRLPWSIAFRGSLGDSSIDLRDLELRFLEITGGAGELWILLSAPRGLVRVVIGGGASNVTIVHPDGAAVRLRIAGGASRLAFDGKRVDALGGETLLETPNAGSAVDRYEIEILGGASGLTVTEFARALTRHGVQDNQGKESTMDDSTTLVERYLETWNERDPSARRAAVGELWAKEAAYVDPLASVEGHDAISDLIGAVQGQAPGYVFRPLDGVDAHHNVARFRWELVPAEGGEPVAIGFDVAITDGDGRIGKVIGFLDKAPA
jgi:SnoaL-like domain